MARPQTIETVCFATLLVSVSTAIAVWMWGMVRKSFGAIPALLWIVLVSVSLVCTAIIGILEFGH